MNYERINWENAPSTDTPLDADNLNKMDEALDTLNREVAKTRSDIQEVEETAASLGSQIAGIIRLEDGSTTGDAELINGRVGKDGTTYSTIGDAIRGQIGDLRDHVIEVSDEEPEEFYNKIWVNDGEDEIEIPTKAELDAVEDEVAELNERIGDISETSTTKNMCDDEPLKSRTGITHSNGVFTGKASDFSSYVLLDAGFESGKRYTVSFYGQNTGSNVSGNGLGVRIDYTDESYVATYLPNSTSEYSRFVATSGVGKTVSSIRLYYNSGGANIWNIKQIQIEEGSSATDYIPHNVITAYDKTARYGVSSLETTALKSDDIIIADKSVYSSFDDLPLNKVVLIPYAVTLDDGPDGYAYIGHGTLDTGKYNATVLTFSATSSSPSQVVQICYQYRDIYDFTKQPHVATRYGLMTNGSIVWGDWSTLSQDSVLHSSNRVVDIDTYQQVTFGDFNDAPVNAIYQVDLNTGTTVLNNPSPGHSGLLMTFAFSPITRHALIQHHYALEDDDIAMYFRYGYKNAPNDFRWTAWRKVATNIVGNYVENNGKLASNTNLNTLTDNAIYLLGYNVAYINRPWETLAGFLTTKTVGLITLQVAEGLDGVVKRRSTADGGTTWTAWG